MSSDLLKYEWIGHATLKRMVRVKGVVICDEPLRIGVGKAIPLYELTDLIVAKIYDPRTGDYIPFIPGSSWKGVFRSHSVNIKY